MGRWQDRREAARRRMMWRPGPTPKVEEDVLRANAKIAQEWEEHFNMSNQKSEREENKTKKENTDAKGVAGVDKAAKPLRGKTKRGKAKKRGDGEEPGKDGGKEVV